MFYTINDVNSQYIPLISLVFSVRTASYGQIFSFLLWPKREARGPWKQGREKRGSITCCTDRAIEANKMFIIWLCCLFRFWKGDRELEVRTASYGPGIDQSQHAISFSHLINMFSYEHYYLFPFLPNWLLMHFNTFLNITLHFLECSKICTF